MVTPSPQQSYPKPTVDYADANAERLDPNKVPATGTTVRCQYSPIVPHQRVDLQWEGVSVYSEFTEVPPEGAAEVVFSITKALVTDNLNTTVQVYYEVDGRPSTRQSLRVIADLPAPTVVQAPTGELNPMSALNGASVKVSYPGMTSDDIIGLSWAGNSSLVPQRPGNTSGTLYIVVPASAVAAALGKTVQVIYSVKRGEEITPSGILNLTVLLIPPENLDPPRLLEAENDGEGPELDLENVSSGGNIRVNIWPLIAVGQYPWLRLEGNKAEGTAHNLTLWTPANADVSQVWLDQGYYPKAVGYDYLKELGNGTRLRLIFKAGMNGSREEADAIAFPVRTYTVKANLPAPTVVQAPTGELNPMSALNGASVKVSYPGMTSDDIIGLSWAGNNSLVPQRYGNTSGTLYIVVPASAVAAALGKTVQVIYAVERGEEIMSSGILNLTVLLIPPENLNSPRLLEAENDGEGPELNLENVSSGGNIRVNIWPLIAVGQYPWLSLEGNKAEGTAHNLTLWTPANASVSQVWLDQGYYPKAVGYDYLKELGNGTRLKLIFKAGMNGSPEEADAIAFPVRTYTVKALPSELFIDFTQEVTIYLRAIEFYRLQHFVITQLVDDAAGGHPPGTAGVYYPTYMTTSKCLIISRRMRIDLLQKNAWQMIFRLFNSNPAIVVSLFFYDAAGGHIWTWYQSGSLDGRVCSTGSIPRFSSIEVEVVPGSLAYLDDIHLYY
jgi:hypothetical protein